jgi:hypothetical protein
MNKKHFNSKIYDFNHFFLKHHKIWMNLLPIDADKALEPNIVRNLPMKSTGIFGLSAIVIQPVLQISVKVMKHFRRPIMFEMIPPNGLMQKAQAMYMAAIKKITEKKCFVCLFFYNL